MKTHESAIGVNLATPGLREALSKIGQLYGGRLEAAVSVATGLAIALGALPDGSKGGRKASRQLRKAAARAAGSAGDLLRATRRYVRKHPLQSAAVAIAAGGIVAIEAARRLRGTVDATQALAESDGDMPLVTQPEPDVVPTQPDGAAH